MNDLSKISGADFLCDYKLTLTFSDGTKRNVDFAPYLNSEIPKYLHKYRDQKHFKKFKIESGNLVWGDDWDLIFPVDQLYKGSLDI